MWPRRGSSAMSPGQMPNLAFGIFLTMLGVLLTFDSLGLVDASRALRWWPLGFHVLGVTLLLRRQDSHGRFWGIAWLVLGTWLLLNTLGLARIGFWDLLWPAVLITVGVRLILRSRRPVTERGTVSDGSAAVPIMGTPGRPNLVAVMSEAKNTVTQPITGASLTSVMGGCHLDLRQATVRPGDAPVIDVFSIMGGQEIVMPAGWKVTFDVVAIFSATEDKRLPAVPGQAETATPEITVRGFTLFSGLTVKS